MKTKVKKKRTPREKDPYAKTLKAWGFERATSSMGGCYERKVNIEGGHIGIRLLDSDVASLPKKADLGVMVIRMVATAFMSGEQKGKNSTDYDLRSARADRDTYKGRLDAIDRIVGGD